MEFVQEQVLPHFNYWVYVVLMMIGLYAMISKNNLVKKLIGMSIFQTAIILFFVSLGVKSDADIPILHHHGHADHHEEVKHTPDSKHEENAKTYAAAENKTKSDHHPEKGDSADHAHGSGDAINPDDYANPLPHVLMLTAIVVGVATLGVALAVVQLIFRDYGTVEEDEILAQIGSSHG